MSKAMNLIKKTDKVMEIVTKIVAYVAAGALIFNMLILVGAVKMADKVVHEMLGV